MNMSKIKQILFNHKIAFLLAILTSIIIAFPQVYFHIDQKDIIQEGVQSIELLPDSPWSARVREVQDGHINFGGMYYKYDKSLPYLHPPLGSMTVAYMGKLLSLDINNTILLSRLVLPFFVFLLIYWFTLLLSRRKLVALAAAATITLAEPILNFAGLFRFLNGISPSSFLELARPVNSAMIFIPFFAFLGLFWLFYRKKDWRWGVASAIILGLNFYNYFYTWTYLYAFGGLLVLIFLIQRNWKEATRISLVFLGALLVAIPYIINLYSITLYPAYEAVSLRLGLVSTHSPLFVGLTVIGALVVFFLGFPKEDREKYYFSLALLLAPFVTMNQQLLTGKIIQTGHYHWYFHKPIAVIFVIWVIFHLLSRLKLEFYKKILAGLIIAVSIFVGVFTQFSSYLYDKGNGIDITAERQRYGPVMDWLNVNTEKEAVVFTNDEISHITVIYTPLNVFYHRAAHISLNATEERVRNILFTFYRLEGIEKGEAQEFFHNEGRVYISKVLYGVYYRDLFESYSDIPDEKIDEIIALYEYTLLTPTSEWLRDIWEEYEVEYFVWDKKSDPEWQLERFSFLEEAALFGDIAIYKFSLDL